MGKIIGFWENNRKEVEQDGAAEGIPKNLDLPWIRYGEYHLDVRYNTDTDELINMKERKAVYDKSMEPINARDAVVKFASAFENEWEMLKITKEILILYHIVWLR